jgi:hypothetical protein
MSYPFYGEVITGYFRDGNNWQEKPSAVFLFADSYTDAMRKMEEYYGEEIVEITYLAPFEETSIPKEEVSATFTEGVVENTDVTQLDTPALLREIKAQLKEEGISAKDIKIIMSEAYNQLQEMGLGSYYAKDQESKIKTIVDKIKNCS